MLGCAVPLANEYMTIVTRIISQPMQLMEFSIEITPTAHPSIINATKERAPAAAEAFVGGAPPAASRRNLGFPHFRRMSWA